MAEETAKEAAQRDNTKRLPAKERKTTQLDENQPGQRESKRIKTENDSDDKDGARTELPTRKQKHGLMKQKLGCTTSDNPL